MNNSKWSYKTPVEDGYYYVNMGDVVTVSSLSFEHFVSGKDGILYDRSLFPVDEYNTNCKFLKVDIDALNEIANE
jgi:hypothetical protein